MQYLALYVIVFIVLAVIFHLLGTRATLVPSVEELRLGLVYLFHTTERFVHLVVLIFVMIITAIYYGGFMYLYGKVAQREVSKQQANN